MRKSLIIFFALSIFLTACTAKEEPAKQEPFPAAKEAVEEIKETSTPVPTKEAKAEDKELILVTSHPLVCRSQQGKEIANGKYPEIRLTSEGENKYPGLKSTLDGFNDNWAGVVRNSVGVYGTYVLEDENTTGPYSSEITSEINRLDDVLLTVKSGYYDYSGGAHPNHYIEIDNIDPMTGNTVKLSDVVTDPAAFPKIIENTIYETYPEQKEEIKQYNSFNDSGDPSEVFTKKLTDDSYSWELTKGGLEITFSPYDIASYAAGYIEISIPYDKYPELVKSTYIPSEEADVTSLIGNREADTEEIEPAEPEGIWEDGPGEPISSSVSNPTWERFADEECKPAALSHISIEKLTEKKTDWLDTDKWAAENGFRKELMPYNDGEYCYEPYDPVEYDYMYNAIRIYDKNRLTVLYDLDLHILVNGPDEKTGKTPLVTEFIRWAKISGDVLYVAAGHNTYASSEPDSSYILAIRLSDAKLLWRSEPLVSNALNFLVDGDTIICGYGFTAEDDFIYLLDKNTGERIDKIKVNSGPDQFEIVGDTLYVATYNTAYTFKITRP